MGTLVNSGAQGIASHYTTSLEPRRSSAADGTNVLVLGSQDLSRRRHQQTLLSSQDGTLDLEQLQADALNQNNSLTLKASHESLQALKEIYSARAKIRPARDLSTFCSDQSGVRKGAINLTTEQSMTASGTRMLTFKKTYGAVEKVPSIARRKLPTLEALSTNTVEACTANRMSSKRSRSRPLKPLQVMSNTFTGGGGFPSQQRSPLKPFQVMSSTVTSSGGFTSKQSPLKPFKAVYTITGGGGGVSQKQRSPINKLGKRSVAVESGNQQPPAAHVKGRLRNVSPKGLEQIPSKKTQNASPKPETTPKRGKKALKTPKRAQASSLSKKSNKTREDVKSPFQPAVQTSKAVSKLSSSLQTSPTTKSKSKGKKGQKSNAGSALQGSKGRNSPIQIVKSYDQVGKSIPLHSGPKKTGKFAKQKIQKVKYTVSKKFTETTLQSGNETEGRVGPNNEVINITMVKEQIIQLSSEGQGSDDNETRLQSDGHVEMKIKEEKSPPKIKEADGPSGDPTQNNAQLFGKRNLSHDNTVAQSGRGLQKTASVENKPNKDEFQAQERQEKSAIAINLQLIDKDLKIFNKPPPDTSTEGGNTLRSQRVQDQQPDSIRIAQKNATELTLMSPAVGGKVEESQDQGSDLKTVHKHALAPQSDNDSYSDDDDQAEDEAVKPQQSSLEDYSEIYSEVVKPQQSSQEDYSEIQSEAVKPQPSSQEDYSEIQSVQTSSKNKQNVLIAASQPNIKQEQSSVTMKTVRVEIMDSIHSEDERGDKSVKNAAVVENARVSQAASEESDDYEMDEDHQEAHLDKQLDKSKETSGVNHSALSGRSIEKTKLPSHDQSPTLIEQPISHFSHYSHTEGNVPNEVTQVVHDIDVETKPFMTAKKQSMVAKEKYRTITSSRKKKNSSQSSLGVSLGLSVGTGDHSQAKLPSVNQFLQSLKEKQKEVQLNNDSSKAEDEQYYSQDGDQEEGIDLTEPGIEIQYSEDQDQKYTEQSSLTKLSKHQRLAVGNQVEDDDEEYTYGSESHSQVSGLTAAQINEIQNDIQQTTLSQGSRKGLIPSASQLLRNLTKPKKEQSRRDEEEALSECSDLSPREHIVSYQVLREAALKSGFKS